MIERRYVTKSISALAGMLAIFATAAIAQATPGLNGAWEAVRVNKQALPMTDQVVGQDGFTHAIRLHDMSIRLRPNGRFQAALRYRQAILTKGELIDKAPLQTDTWVGTYSLVGTHLKFVPEKQGKRQVQPFEGDVGSGQRISVGFDYNIVTKKHYLLDLNLNKNIY